MGIARDRYVEKTRDRYLSLVGNATYECPRERELRYILYIEIARDRYVEVAMDNTKGRSGIYT